MQRGWEFSIEIRYRVLRADFPSLRGTRQSRYLLQGDGKLKDSVVAQVCLRPYKCVLGYRGHPD